MTHHLLDIIIVTWNSSELTTRCVKNILEKSRKENIPSMVWVVDNNSNDNTIEQLTEMFPEINIIPVNYNSGFSTANNIAIKQSSAPYVLLLNSDAFPEDGCLTKLILELQNNPTVGTAGPLLRLGSGEIQRSVTKVTTPMFQLLYLASFHFPPFEQIFRRHFNKHRSEMCDGNHARTVPLMSAACLMIKREVFDLVGLLPEDRFLYSEEDDLFFRINRTKYKNIYIPTAEAVHLCGASTPKPPTVKKDDFFLRSRLKFLFKHYPKQSIFIYIIHWVFLKWCSAVFCIKLTLRGREGDKISLMNSIVLSNILESEFNNASQNRAQQRANRESARGLCSRRHTPEALDDCHRHQPGKNTLDDH